MLAGKNRLMLMVPILVKDEFGPGCNDLEVTGCLKPQSSRTYGRQMTFKEIMHQADLVSGETNMRLVAMVKLTVTERLEVFVSLLLRACPACVRP